MRAGKLRHSIILQSPAGSRDAVGGRVTTWTSVATTWANVEPLTVREQTLAAQRQASTTHKVTLRYQSALAAMDSSWRVLFGTRVLTLDGPPIKVEEINKTIELTCVEGLADE